MAIENSEGVGGLKGKYEAKLEFLDGLGGGAFRGKTIHRGGLGLFWNHTFSLP